MNERTWHFLWHQNRLWPLLHIFRGQDPNTPRIYTPGLGSRKDICHLKTLILICRQWTVNWTRCQIFSYTTEWTAVIGTISIIISHCWSTAVNAVTFWHRLTSGFPKYRPLNECVVSNVPKFPIRCYEVQSVQYIVVMHYIYRTYSSVKLGWLLGYWHQRAGNPPQGNQKLFVVRDKVGRPPGELGVSKSMECDIFPFRALTLFVGWQEGHPACKKTWMLVCWWWWFDWSVARLIAPVVQLSPPPPSSFASINTG